jgi:Membrane protein involved in the export of O-antigen and teichoic acid
MNQKFVNIAQKIGMDKAIVYTSGNGIIGAFIGVFSVVLYATCLTKEEQGYYYTFASVLAIQGFFELGFTGIMTQFVAHEHAHLTWNNDCIGLNGDRKYRSRLASLLHICVKWYFLVAVLFLFSLQVAGTYFFEEFGKDEGVNWKMPWIIISCMSAWSLFTAPLFSFMTGLGLVKDMAKMNFYRTIVNTMILWCCLLLGLKLYSMAFSAIVSAVYVILYFATHKFFKILFGIWKTEILERVSYLKEIFPYQWRIALSWISGYFIFNFMNPVIFAMVGSVSAGQFGMSINVLNQIRNFAMSWITTKVPLMSRLIELKDYFDLDKLFKKTVIQEIFVCLVLLCGFWGTIFVLKETHFAFSGNVLSERFLDYLPLLLVSIPVVLQAVTDNFATYLRCHKKEPFLVISIANGIASAASILILGKYLGLYGITCGYCCLAIVFFPWGYWIYKTKKAEWHR